MANATANRAWSTSRAGLVLSGGGSRCAYQVGVIRGIQEALDPGRGHASPFQIVAGASIGAINAAAIAANAHSPDLNIEHLIKAWTTLDFSSMFLPTLLSFARQLFRDPNALRSRSIKPVALMNQEPLEHLVREAVDFRALHSNIAGGAVDGLILAALHLATGRTTLFCELADAALYKTPNDPRQIVSREPITFDHVLASAAVPLMFPPRRIGEDLYCDGGLRLDTPIAPAIRAGAKKVVIVSTGSPTRRPNVPAGSSGYPSFGFICGKLLNALLLDPLERDLQALKHVNDLVDIHRRGLRAELRDELDQLLERTRGARYRRVDSLVFYPSTDLARMATDFMARNLKKFDVGLVARRLLRSAIVDPEGPSDWIPYLVFDGELAAEIIELGFKDACARRDEIRAFFE